VAADRAVAKVVCRLPLIAESGVRSQVNSCGVCGGKSGTGADLSLSTAVFPCQHHTNAPHTYLSSRLIQTVSNVSL